MEKNEGDSFAPLMTAEVDASESKYIDMYSNNGMHCK